MEREERKTAPLDGQRQGEGEDLINLRYEVASAKRQIASLQDRLDAKGREAACLRDQLIERDVLLKEAAACICDALELCREQLAQMDRTSRLYMSYEMEWRAISARLSRMKDQLPQIPASQEPAGSGRALEEVRSRVEDRVEAAGENLRKLFGE